MRCSLYKCRRSRSRFFDGLVTTMRLKKDTSLENTIAGNRNILCFFDAIAPCSGVLSDNSK
jgi:hypothetical protein